MAESLEANVTRQPRLPHMELLNVKTGDVWLCQEPVTFEVFKAIKVAAPLIKSGCTTAAFDAAEFLRSPGAAADGPVDTCTVDGLAFSRVARALHIGGGFRGEAPTRVKVEKHHRMTFAAGGEVTLARLPDGRYYVQQTEPIPGKTFAAPADWQLLTRRLETAWTLLVPPPVEVWFFASLASFQGPLPATDLRQFDIM